MTTVPAGTAFQVQSFTNHRRKDLWGLDADEWKPERWEGYGDIGSFGFEDAGETHTVTYSARNPESRRFHPFTRRPRDCFGKNFAQAEIRVVIPVLLSQFEFKLAEPSKSLANTSTDQLVYQLTGVLKPRDGLWMYATPREGIEVRHHASKL